MIYYSNLASYVISMAINLTVMGAFFAVGIAFSFRLARQLSPRVRYIVAVVAFFTAAALPIYSTIRLPQEPAAAPQGMTAIERWQHPSVATPILNQGSQISIEGSDATKMSNGTSLPMNEAKATVFDQALLSLNAFIRASAESWPGVGFIALWGFIAVLLVGREMLGYIQLAKARSTWQIADAKTIDSLGWPGAYPLFISEYEGPYTVGLVRPAVVIPSDLLDDISPDAARLIARHELAHARWQDPLVNALLRLTRALLWPSLPLWYLGRVARREREAASDFSAVAGCCYEEIESTVIEYATLLVSVAGRSGEKSRRLKYEWAATEVGNHVDLESRITRLLKISSRPTRARLLLAAFAFTATVWGAAFLPVAAGPIVLMPDPNVSDVGVVEESKAAIADADTAPVASTGPSIPPAPYNGNPGPLDKDQLIQSQNEQHTARAASESPSDKAQEYNKEGAGPMLALQTAQPNQDETSHDFVKEMAALGYTGLSFNQLAAMKESGLSHAYIKEMAASGYDKLSADALINFRWLGINPVFIKDMSKLGYSDLSANTLIDFRLYGITAPYIKGMADLGLANLPAKTLVAFRRLGIGEAYIKGLRAQGYEHLTADRIIDLRTQNVSVGESGKRGNGQND
jgi:Zn-dependent protease with chaperone function